jgi:hypothetical protein
MCAVLNMADFCIIIIIIIIIIIKDTISFMQGIYTYIPETNHVPKQYNVAAILSLLFTVHISLVSALALMYFYISTFRSMCAVLNMAVFCIIIIIIIIIIINVQRSLCKTPFIV